MKKKKQNVMTISLFWSKNEEKEIKCNDDLTISMIKPSLRKLNPENPCKQDEFMKFHQFFPINERKHVNISWLTV